MNGLQESGKWFIRYVPEDNIYKFYLSKGYINEGEEGYAFLDYGRWDTLSELEENFWEIINAGY